MPEIGREEARGKSHWAKRTDYCCSKRVLLMRNAESASNLTFQVAMSSDGMKRLWSVSKQSSTGVPGTIRYRLSCPTPNDKLSEIARPRPLKSSKVVR